MLKDTIGVLVFLGIVFVSGIGVGYLIATRKIIKEIKRVNDTGGYWSTCIDDKLHRMYLSIEDIRGIKKPQIDYSVASKIAEIRSEGEPAIKTREVPPEEFAKDLGMSAGELLKKCDFQNMERPISGEALKAKEQFQEVRS